MKPAPFAYAVPDTVDEVLDLLGEHGDEAKLLAGGQSLIPAMNFRLAQPTTLIDLNRLVDLQYIREDKNGEIAIGAMTRQRELERSPLISKGAPLIHETMPVVAHPQIRNRGTLGGSLAHADPAAELPVVMLALRGRMRIRSKGGERWVESGQFFQGLFATDLKLDEMLVEIVIPAQPARTGWCFEEVARRRGDYAMMGVAAMVRLDDGGACEEARLVYLNAGDRPIEAPGAAGMLIGQKAGKEAIEAAADHASRQEIDPFGNVHASPEYQRHLARVLTHRTLETAFRRAANGKGK